MKREEDPDARRAERIVVYGVTGSGKTSLAHRISEVLDMPSHSMDDEVGWLPGWVERPGDEQRRLVSETSPATGGCSAPCTGSGWTSCWLVPS